MSINPNTGTFGITDNTATTTATSLFYPQTFSGTSINYDVADISAFIREWKKLRLELLPLLLKDEVHWNILSFNMNRAMNEKTKETEVTLIIKYRPLPEDKKGVRKKL